MKKKMGNERRLCFLHIFFLLLLLHKAIYIVGEKREKILKVREVFIAKKEEAAAPFFSFW